MKNKLLLLFLCFSYTVFGQFVAGTKMVEGGFNLNVSVTGNDKNADADFKAHNIQIGLWSQVAYIQSETRQWGFGGSLSFLQQSSSFISKNAFNNTITSNLAGFSFAPTIFQTRLKKLAPNFYGGIRYAANMGYTITQSENNYQQSGTSSPNVQSSGRISMGITSQFYYFMTPQWGLSANIGYANMGFGRYFESKTWAFNTDAGFGGLGFGLFKMLNLK